MTIFQTIALLLTIAAAGAYINRRFFKLPATIGLMVFALLISMAAIGLNKIGWISLAGATAFVGHIDFSNILLHGMLSFLLFAGAMHVNLSDLKKHQTIVAILATVGVVIATFATGFIVKQAAYWIGLDIPFIYALLFGALIAPTDPVAVLGIIREANMPRGLRTKIGCESLLNDGVGVVIFLIMLNVVINPSQPLTYTDIFALLAWAGGGAVILGLTLGWITYRLIRGIDDYKTEVLLTLALAAGGYCLAEAVEVSAPITMVIAGLVIGNQARNLGMSEQTRQHLDVFWELLDEILNAVLFMLMGLEMVIIPFSSLYFALGLAAIVATLVGRFISVAAPVWVMRLRYRFERGTVRLLTWGGLRGGISIALALSLPAGHPKDLILAMTYITVVFSVLFQGTTFRHVARLVLKQ